MRPLSDATRLIVNKVIRSEMEEGRQTKLNDCVDISSVKLLGVVPYDSSAMNLSDGGRLSGFIGSAFLESPSVFSAKMCRFRRNILI